MGIYVEKVVSIEIQFNFVKLSRLQIEIHKQNRYHTDSVGIKSLIPMKIRPYDKFLCRVQYFIFYPIHKVFCRYIRVF